ncbi:hypothetical protein [Mycobacteroides abscessus]|uniref:hypothetical protein n=1 Tax=Mycobacteroides abscessus TaxID=36809 RepID=UPI001041D2A4|nr:hypothetical protein [Mycobacteroides abscessus]
MHFNDPKSVDGLTHIDMELGDHAWDSRSSAVSRFRSPPLTSNVVSLTFSKIIYPASTPPIPTWSRLRNKRSHLGGVLRPLQWLRQAGAKSA